MKRASWNRPARLWPLLALLLTACAGSPAPKTAAPAPAVSNRNPDDVAANALSLWATGGLSQALAQMQTAARLAPERPDLIWLHLRLCMDVKG